MDKVYLVLPGCDDTNRGDQALIWETVRLAKDAGYEGKYYMVATEECAKQSKALGIERMDYVLPHPSQHVKKDKDNRRYGALLKLKWAFVSALDLLAALPLLCRPLRKLITPLLGRDKQATIQTYKKAGAAFVKGGGFLHAYGGITESYKIFFFLYHIKLALSMGIPVYVMPNSFGPFDGMLVSRMIRNTLKKCRLVCSRESISQKMLLDKCGVDSLLTNDLALYLKKDESFDAEMELGRFSIDTASENVAITLRPYRFPGMSDPAGLYAKYKQSVADFVVWLDKNGYIPCFVEHTFSEGFHEQDMIAIKEVISMLPEGTNYRVFNNLELNCSQMKTVYAKFRYIVGTRFHSMVFALTEGVPGIAITYGGNKGDGIMKDMGLGDYTIPIHEITSEKLISLFKRLIVNRHAAVELMNEFVSSVEEERTRMFDRIR